MVRKDVDGSPPPISSMETGAFSITDMGKRLPYFPFYALDWITDPQVQGLSNEQRGIFHWLLCRQWLDGDLPEEPMMVYPLLPPGSESSAVIYVLDTFFPIVGGGKRRNRRLSDIRDDLEAKHAAKAGGAKKARLAKSAKYRQDKQLPVSDINADIKGRIKNQNQNQKEDVDEDVLRAADYYLRDTTTRTSRIGALRGLLQGMTGAPIKKEALIRGLEDMKVAGARFTALSVRGFARKAQELLEGEAGRRAAEGRSSILGYPDANHGHSGWAEDEAET